MSARTRVNSRSTVKISVTLLLRSSKASRLFSSARELFKRAPRSINCSVTSSLPRLRNCTSPRDSICSRASENPVWGTRIVRSARGVSEPPELDKCSTKPPRLSATARARSTAASTSSTSIDREAMNIILRSPAGPDCPGWLGGRSGNDGPAGPAAPAGAAVAAGWAGGGAGLSFEKALSTDAMPRASGD